ncbi:hypothetical protein [Paenibacillus cymbidii]|uniref:hypothetical protein n=1 Tax=Paenibacillus cymbidii TaxID=1639034 RepID=UPI00108071D8|nr:hypothetical protein [Paenibacillus cymbidii]
MQPRVTGPNGNPPTGGSSVIKPPPNKLEVQVHLNELDLFKALASATALMFERSDADTKAEVIGILKDHGGAILVTRQYCDGPTVPG